MSPSLRLVRIELISNLEIPPGHLQKAVSLLPSLFITVFIYYRPYQTASLNQGHSCYVPPGRVTPLTHWPNIWRRDHAP